MHIMEINGTKLTKINVVNGVITALSASLKHCIWHYPSKNWILLLVVIVLVFEQNNVF